MCVYIHVCVYICVCLYVCVCIHVCVCVCVCVYILFLVPSFVVLLQDIEYSSLCYTVNPCLFILYIFYIWWCPSVNPLLITRASLVAQTVKNLPAMQKTRVQSLCWEDPLEKGMTTPSRQTSFPPTEEPGRV